MKGVGVDNGGRRIISSANVIDFFCTPITIGGGGGGIGFEDVRGGGIGIEDVGGSGIGVENGGGNVDGGGGGEGGGEDGGGRGHEDGMVQMTLPLGTCEDIRGTIGV
jgi:hypothetical protein